METERLKLVPPCLELQPQILDAIVESKIELSEFLTWVPYALTEKESIENTKQAIANFNNIENELRFSILNKQNNKLVGAIGLIIRDKTVPFFEVGYWLRTTCVGFGYAAEAVSVIEKYAFEQLNANRLEIKCAELNVKSKTVALRCGYEFEGRMKNTNRLPSGELSNTLVFAKTR